MNHVPPGFEKTVTKLDNGLVKVQIGRQVEYKKGDEFGMYHREDGPAFIGETGTWMWYKDGLVHRLDGPATLDHNGIKRWFKDGKLHRLDGPAIEWPDGRAEYWLEGARVKQLPLTKMLLNFLENSEK